MPFVSAKYQPIVMPFPDGARPVEAIDDQGAKWVLMDNSELGDWLRYLEAGGTIDPMDDPDVPAAEPNVVYGVPVPE